MGRLDKSGKSIADRIAEINLVRMMGLYNDEPAWWWLRSPYNWNDNNEKSNFADVNNNGSVNNNNSNNNNGVAPCLVWRSQSNLMVKSGRSTRDMQK